MNIEEKRLKKENEYLKIQNAFLRESIEEYCRVIKCLTELRIKQKIKIKINPFFREEKKWMDTNLKKYEP